MPVRVKSSEISEPHNEDHIHQLHIFLSHKTSIFLN